MNCTKCGAPLEEGARFCEACGEPVNAENAASGKVMEPAERNAYQRIPDAGNYDTGVRFDTKKIRKWFRGKPMWPVLFTIIGILLLLVRLYVPGILLTLGGGAIWFMLWSAATSTTEIDRAWNTYIDVLTKRGVEKLNVIQEQVGMIEPVVLVGYGENPDSTFSTAKLLAKEKKLFAFRKRGIELDPYVAYRIGQDDILRSLLISTTVYMFSEEQLLVYNANLDISTGLIYKESTEEIFYKDIEGIRFGQKLFKAYSMKRKRFVNQAQEIMTLYLSGLVVETSYRTGVNDSRLQNQFAAMRNLIRDKKNA